MAKKRGGKSDAAKATSAPPNARGKNFHTPVWKAKFIETLKKVGAVLPSAELVGVDKSTVYRARASDPEFAQAWDEALERSVEDVEAVLHHWALRGVARPVYYQGAVVGQETVVQPRLIELYLKAHKPEKYRENYAVAKALVDAMPAIDPALAEAMLKTASQMDKASKDKGPDS
jgi:hypothetical protein